MGGQSLSDDLRHIFFGHFPRLCLSAVGALQPHMLFRLNSLDVLCLLQKEHCAFPLVWGFAPEASAFDFASEHVPHVVFNSGRDFEHAYAFSSFSLVGVVLSFLVLYLLLCLGPLV